MIISHKELIKTHNIFKEGVRNSLNNMKSYASQSININRNILDNLRPKEKPITINKCQNKINKKYLLNYSGINRIRNNITNHIYHEIKSFSGEKDVPKKPIKDFGTKTININNGSRQINIKKNIKNNFTLSNSFYKNKGKNIKIFNRGNDKETKRPNKDISINQKNKNEYNKRKNFSMKYFNPYNEVINNLNGIDTKTAL